MLLQGLVLPEQICWCFTTRHYFFGFWARQILHSPVVSWRYSNTTINILGICNNRMDWIGVVSTVKFKSTWQHFPVAQHRYFHLHLPLFYGASWQQATIADGDSMAAAATWGGKEERYCAQSGLRQSPPILFLLPVAAPPIASVLTPLHQTAPIVRTTLWSFTLRNV